MINRGAPRDEQPLGKFDQRIKNDADDREDKQRGKCERRIQILIGDEDQVAQPAVAADELADDCSDHGQRDRNLHAAEQLR